MKKILLIINTSCNQSCKYCYYNIGIDKKILGFLDVLAFEKFMDQNVTSVSITGGEPLINPFLYKYINIAKKRTDKIKLSTNGKNLTLPIINKLIRNGINKFYISLDDCSGVLQNIYRSGSANSTTRAIKYLHEKNISVTISSVITKKNIGEIFSIQRFCKDKGFGFWPQPIYLPETHKDYSSLSLQNIANNEWGEMIKNFPDSSDNSRAAMFLKKFHTVFIKKKGAPVACPFDQSSLVINANGDIKKCFHGPKIGNISDFTLSQLKNHKTISRSDCFSEICFQYMLI